MICGVDESGRGCVIGPMVLCIAGIDRLDEFRLKHLGVKDSKKLSAAQRERLCPEIEKLCRLLVIKVPAEELNTLMDRLSLNEIEAMKIGEGINILDYPATDIFIDSPDNIPKNFGKRIEKYLRKKDSASAAKLVCENKADDRHLIVGAASIVAKVTRDREIARIKKIVGYDFNSGYSSDPFTIAYLEKNMSDPKLAPYLRRKWATLMNIKQRKLSEF